MRSLVVLFLLAVVGCAAVPKTPQELGIRHAAIVAGDNKTVVAIDGLPGKGSGAAVGGVKGAAYSAGTGALLCLASGPAYPICIVGAVPASVIGGTAGATVGAVITEGSDSRDEKRTMLTAALAGLDASQALAPLVYKKAVASPVPNLPQGDKTSTTANPEWTLRIEMDEFATAGSGPKAPYLLQLSAHVEIMRIGDRTPAFIKAYQANSPLKMTTSEWRANDDEQVRLALDTLLETLATKISNDLRPIQLSLDTPIQGYKVAMANETKSEPLVPLKSETVQSLSQIVAVDDSSSQSSLFDSETGANWIIVGYYPVTLATANRICNSLESPNKKKYSLPSSQEFEKLWRRYKNDERINIFKKRDYCTSDIPAISQKTSTFSFADGTSGPLYSGYLACISK